MNSTQGGMPDDEPLIDVSDLYDSFHELANRILRGFELPAGEADAEIEPGFDVLIDQLELDLFLPSCARRLWRLRRLLVEADDVPGMIRLYDHADEPLHGAAGIYHSHAFVLYAPDDTNVPNEVLSGDLLPRSRADVRLCMDTRLAGYGRGHRPPLKLLKVIDDPDDE